MYWFHLHINMFQIEALFSVRVQQFVTLIKYLDAIKFPITMY